MMRLPRGSWLRRAWLERNARAGYEAWNRVDMKAARAFADPEVEVYVAQEADLPVGLEVGIGWLAAHRDWARECLAE
jgi:hypothetical protein